MRETTKNIIKTNVKGQNSRVRHRTLMVVEKSNRRLNLTVALIILMKFEQFRFFFF